MVKDPSDIVRKGYNQAALNYLKERSEDLLDIGLFLKFSRRCQSILELGCGAGYPVARFLIEAGKEYCGIDISERQVKLAREEYPEGRFIVSDMVNFLERSADNRYDGILLLFSLFHVPRTLHTLILQKIYCILRPGGYLLLNTGDQAYEGIETNWLGAEEMYWSLMSPQWYQTTMMDLGFDNMEHDLVIKEFMGEAESTHFYLAQKPNQ